MIAERLTGTEPPEVIERHVNRYRTCIGLAETVGGVWWDVACGTGYGTQIMPADVAFGFDRVPPVRNIAGDYFKADITQAGWSSEAFDAPDVVLCIETLEHLSRLDQDGFVQEIANRLKSDGVFVLACPLGNGKSETNPWHLHEPTESELYELLFRHFNSVWVGVDHYESTSGPAVQAYATARGPR